jgi:hypothetical protein
MWFVKGNMKFLYLVRRDEEWHKYQQYSKILGKALQSQKMAECWDSIFSTTWINFRIECDKIRLENEKDLNFDAMMSTYEICSHRQLHGYTVVPCDDDDWLRDDIFDILRENCNKNNKTYRWNFTELSIIENGFYELCSFSYPTNIPYPSWDLSYNYQSNNYAVSNPDDLISVDLHGHADNIFDVTREKFIPLSLSVHNGNLGSLTFMRRVNKWYKGDMRTGMIDMLRRFKSHYPIKNTETPVYFDRFIDRMLDLYLKIKIK